MKTFRIVTDLEVPEGATAETLREILERIGTPSSDTHIVEVTNQNPDRLERALGDARIQWLPVVPVPHGASATSFGSDAEEAMAGHDDDGHEWINVYRCVCGTKWEDRWSCQCNDRCPKCAREIEPLESYRAAA